MRSMVWSQGNEIFFFADFTRPTVNELIKLIIKNKDKKDLVINVKSYGGSADELRAAIDLVNKYNVRVHVVGYADSAGFYLMCAAKRRSMEPTARLTYHEASYGERGTATEVKRSVEQTARDERVFKKFIVDTGAFTWDELKEYDNRIEDWVIDYEDAKSRGLLNYSPDGKKENSKIKDIEVE